LYRDGINAESGHYRAAFAQRPCWHNVDGGFHQPHRDFEKTTTIAAFVGGNVQTIRVIHYDPTLTPAQVEDQVRKVWLSWFRYAESFIGWSEGNNWTIDAVIEFDDGNRASLVTNGSHTRFQDREGNYWFVRLCCVW
jgi:hypothetical protein